MASPIDESDPLADLKLEVELEEPTAPSSRKKGLPPPLPGKTVPPPPKTSSSETVERRAELDELRAVLRAEKRESESLLAQLSEVRAELAQAQKAHGQLNSEIEHARQENERLTAVLAKETTARAESDAFAEHLSQENAQLRSRQSEFATLERELQAERASGGSPALRKAREELLAANTKAMELGVQLQTERRDKQALAFKLASLERAAPPSTENNAEKERLQAELTALKKKLVLAESAREAAASLGAKVARLEAQLKGKK